MNAGFNLRRRNRESSTGDPNEASTGGLMPSSGTPRHLSDGRRVAPGIRLRSAGLYKSTGTLLAVSLALCACRSAPLQCGGVPAPWDLTPIEQNVITDAVRRAEATCGKKGQGCKFNLSPHQSGWSVMVQIRPYNAKYRLCLQDPGGNWIDLYDAKGVFSAHLPGV